MASVLIRKFFQDNTSWTRLEDGKVSCEVRVYSDHETGELRVSVEGDEELVQDYVGIQGLHLFVEEFRQYRKSR